MELDKQKALDIIRLTSLCYSEGLAEQSDIDYAYTLVEHFKLTLEEYNYLPPRVPTRFPPRTL